MTEDKDYTQVAPDKGGRLTQAHKLLSTGKTLLIAGSTLVGEAKVPVRTVCVIHRHSGEPHTFGWKELRCAVPQLQEGLHSFDTRDGKVVYITQDERVTFIWEVDHKYASPNIPIAELEELIEFAFSQIPAP